MLKSVPTLNESPSLKCCFSDVAELWSYSLSHFSLAICFFPANETFAKS